MLLHSALPHTIYIFVQLNNYVLHYCMRTRLHLTYRVQLHTERATNSPEAKAPAEAHWIAACVIECLTSLQ